MEAQLKETLYRQQAQVQMYETMINSLKAPESPSPSQLLVAQIEASERQSYEDQITELKEWRHKSLQQLEEKEREITRIASDKDSFIKDL
jgi:hypothetical protein